MNKSLRVNEKKSINLILSMLIISCLYKIAVVNGGIIEAFLTPIMNAIPFSDIARYTRTINIIRIPFLGLFLHLMCFVIWSFEIKGKAKIKRSRNCLCLFFILLIRLISELIINKNISTYQIGLYFLSFCFLVFFYSIRFSYNGIDEMSDSITKCIYYIGFVCAIFAIIYFVIGLNQSAGFFSFRVFRISGFLFDAILSGFVYGIAFVSAIELYNRAKISKIQLFASLGLFVIGCLLSGSRSSFYFLAIGVWYFLRTRNGAWKYVFFAAFLISGIALYSTYLSGVESSFTSDNARAYKYQLAINLFLDRPFFGVGSNMFYTYDVVYESNPHNLILMILSENGLIGFVPFFIWIIVYIKNIINSNNDYWKWMSICVIVLSMIFGILNNMITFILLVLTSWACEITQTKQSA